MPVAMVRIFGSKMISCGWKWISRSGYDRPCWQISILRSKVAAWPSSSKAMTITAAPYFLIFGHFSLKASSPSFRLMELTIALPCRHFSPASITCHLEESIMTGTLAMSGSAESRFRNLTMDFSASSMASSILISITWAPLSTCCRATDKRFLEILLPDQPGKHLGTADIGPFADIDEIASGEIRSAGQAR